MQEKKGKKKKKYDSRERDREKYLEFKVVMEMKYMWLINLLCKCGYRKELVVFLELYGE